MVTLCNYYNNDMYNHGLVFLIFYVNRRSTDSIKEKPLVMHEYNHYMLGVDKVDQLMSYYFFLHKSIKLWRRVFFWMLEVVVENPYVIYQDTNKEMTHLNSKEILFNALLNHYLKREKYHLLSHHQFLLPLPRIQRMLVTWKREQREEIAFSVVIEVKNAT